MTDKRTEKELAELKAKVAELERASQGVDFAASDRAAAEWRDQMHQASEARMSNAGAWTREDYHNFRAAVPGDTCRDLVQHGTVQSPSGAGASGTIEKVSSNPGLPSSNTGWRD